MTDKTIVFALCQCLSNLPFAIASVRKRGSLTHLPFATGFDSETFAGFDSKNLGWSTIQDVLRRKVVAWHFLSQIILIGDV